MIALRRLFLSSPRLVGVLLAAALLMRLVPAGFMPSIGHGGLRLTMCSGEGVMMVMPAAHGGDMHHGDGDGAPKSRCAFADLALPLMGGVDAIQLAAALAFILVLALAIVAARPPVASTRLRPPLRGPPAF